MNNIITGKTFTSVKINLNVIDQHTGKIVHSGTGNYSDAEFRRWMGDTCRRAFEQGYKVTTTPIEE